MKPKGGSVTYTPKVKITAEIATDRPDLKEYVGQELTAIASLWARTVASPNPAVKGLIHHWFGHSGFRQRRAKRAGCIRWLTARQTRFSSLSALESCLRVSSQEKAPWVVRAVGAF